MTIMFLKWTKLFLFELYIKCKKNYYQLPSRDEIQNFKGFKNQSHTGCPQKLWSSKS